jgi:gamma-glutamyl-gamma-aminobutyraldehyde dehydrogenase
LGFVRAGRNEGATLELGGTPALEESGGAYMDATIFSGVQPGMTIAREEIFGPVLSVLTFDGSEADALRLSNDSRYGLAAAVFTADLGKAHRMARGLVGGTVWVNTWGAGSIMVPFGGFKESGFGRDKSLYSFEKYSDIKTTWIPIGASAGV